MLWSYTTGYLLLKINHFILLLSKKCIKGEKKRRIGQVYSNEILLQQITLVTTKIFFSFHHSLLLKLFMMTKSIFLQSVKELSLLTWLY